MSNESPMNYWTFSWYMLGRDQQHIQTLRERYPDLARQFDAEKEANDKRVAEYRRVHRMDEKDEKFAKKEPAKTLIFEGQYQEGEIVEAWSYGKNARYRITGSYNYSPQEVAEMEDANDIFLDAGWHSFGEYVGLAENQEWPLFQ